MKPKIRVATLYIEPGKCGYCKHFFKGLCLISLKARHPNQPCNVGKFEKGVKDRLSNEELEKVIAKFHELNAEKQVLEWDLTILRNAILESLDGKRVIGNYLVNVSTVKQKRLNTEKVKKLIDSLPDREEYYVEVEYRRVITKKIR